MTAKAVIKDTAFHNLGLEAVKTIVAGRQADIQEITLLVPINFSNAGLISLLYYMYTSIDLH